LAIKLNKNIYVILKLYQSANKKENQKKISNPKHNYCLWFSNALIKTLDSDFFEKIMRFEQEPAKEIIEENTKEVKISERTK
jgi:16S rRNA C967 or C1407 C5-methylase (RsmB/RsmF family)